MEWHGMAWNGMEWHGMAWNGMEWHDPLWGSPLTWPIVSWIPSVASAGWKMQHSEAAVKS